MVGALDIKIKVQTAHILRNLHIPEVFAVYKVQKRVKSVQPEEERAKERAGEGLRGGGRDAGNVPQ